jgi:hypothetical protein
LGPGALFPNADTVASDAFDDFLEDVLPFKDTLPVITAEIGDTWIMGADVRGLYFNCCTRRLLLASNPIHSAS